MTDSDKQIVKDAVDYFCGIPNIDDAVVRRLFFLIEKQEKEIAAAQERITALEEGLREYGRHTNECDIGFECDPVACTCGFSVLFQEIEGKEK